MIFFLINFTSSLSWRCQFDTFGIISTTHFLYKEDNVNEVKWLEKYEYCRAKGDTNVYNDAGQGKCEYSRGLCYWNNGFCENTNRDNDPFVECQDLINNNNLVEGLDNGREQQPQVQQVPEVNQPEVNQPEVNQPEVNQPEINQPEVNQPEVSQPEQVSEPCKSISKTESFTTELSNETQMVSNSILVSSSNKLSSSLLFMFFL